MHTINRSTISPSTDWVVDNTSTVKFHQSRNLIFIKGNGGRQLTGAVFDSIGNLIDIHLISSELLNLCIYINEFDTTTIKGLFGILKSCRDHNQRQKRVIVIWYCRDDGVQMGEDFSELFDLKINIVRI